MQAVFSQISRMQTLRFAYRGFVGTSSQVKHISGSDRSMILQGKVELWCSYTKASVWRTLRPGWSLEIIPG